MQFTSSASLISCSVKSSQLVRSESNTSPRPAPVLLSSLAIVNLHSQYFSWHTSSEIVLMEYCAINISKANQDSWCLETPQCSCSQCKSEADFGSFTITIGNSGSSKGLNDESPKIVNFPDGHRCKRFPCPLCHPGRDRRKGMPQMLEQCPQGVPVVFYGDGGHRCRRFPCPICHARCTSPVNEI